MNFEANVKNVVLSEARQAFDEELDKTSLPPKMKLTLSKLAERIARNAVDAYASRIKTKHADGNDDKARYIPAIDAAKILDVSVMNFMQKRSRYFRFYLPKDKTDDGVAKFDLDGWLKFDDAQKTFVARIGLFIEYAVSECGVTYREIARKASVNATSVEDHPKMGVSTAAKIYEAFRDSDAMRRFLDYYGFEKEAV